MLIRYPGSKQKLLKQIKTYLPTEILGPLFIFANGLEYREPFFGAGAMGFEILKEWPPNSPIWLNDLDYGLVCMWQSIWKDIDRFIDMIERYSPNLQDFYKFKDEDGKRNGDVSNIGFKKLALHQMSYSGLGVMSGGPIGGANQDNEFYNIGVRWSIPNLIKNARICHDILASKKKLEITTRDFSELLIDDRENVFTYLDPPYFEKGEQLYKYSFSYEDHVRLSNILKSKRKMKWILSYDDNPVIRDLYSSWTSFIEIDAIYTIWGGERPKNKEVLIIPKYMDHQGN